MASPNHKAGLAVVVPASDNRCQPRGKFKQNAFSSPRRLTPQSNGISPNRFSNADSCYLNGLASPRQPNGTSTVRQPTTLFQQNSLSGRNVQNMNGTKDRQPNVTAPQPPSGQARAEPNGVLPARQRLLHVDEALQYSPFSSIVPFNSGINYSEDQTWHC